MRRVTASTRTVLRCPDRETADRVAAALKGQAERVNETLVALDPKSLTAADRTRLRDQGILIHRESDAEERRPAVGKRRRS